MKAWLRGALFSALTALLVRRGLTPDQAQVTAEQMTETPLRSLWKAK